MKTQRFLTFAAALTIGAFAAHAGDLPDAKTVAKGLYKTGNRAVVTNVLRPELVAEAYADALVKAAKVQKYYEAMAISPDEGMLGKSATLAANHHSPEAARAAAVAGCNKAKKKSSKDCVVLAEFLPKKYKGPGVVSLSHNASEVFAKSYRRAGKPKSFAISPSSGEWGLATKAASSDAADAAALADCSAKAGKKGASDCELVSRD